MTAAREIHRRPEVADDLIALTFDDGPSNWTLPILDTLRDAGISATFFVIGDAIPGREEILARVSSQGHEVGNHTLRHPRLDLLDEPGEISRELRMTDLMIEEVIGHKPTVFRAPGFQVSPTVLEAVGAYGFDWAIQASVWLEDYNVESSESIIEHVLANTNRGAIIDLHDGRPPHEPRFGEGGSRPDREPTVRAVRELVPRLLERGFRFVTVSELLRL